uniref:Uncharacterized protein LOC104214440 n=1 Tax=Nicotiana sylvestris TaxID=4096 RepID=A0A1U7VJ74_NICSY|nr:PREDICTED: uncharacterized protein LOC104214440 [Nicotiana sylvestris]
MQRTLRVMHASDTKSVELASYRLRDVAVQWYETWELSRGTNASPAARVDRFLALKQGNMSVREYSLQFDSLARYAPSIVAEISDRVHQFVVGLGPYIINECSMATLLDGMDISRIQAYAQNLEDWKRQQYENHDEGQRRKTRSTRRPEDFSGDPMLPYPVESVRQLSGLKNFGFSESEGFSATEGAPSVAHSRQCRQGPNVFYTCERGPQASAGRCRGRGGTSSSDVSQNRIYALAGHQDLEATPDAMSGTVTMSNVRSY